MTTQVSALRLKEVLDRIDADTLEKGRDKVTALWLLEKEAMWRKGVEVLKAYPELSGDKPQRGGRGVVAVSFKSVAVETGRSDVTIARWVKLALEHPQERDFVSWAAEASKAITQRWERSLVPPGHAELIQKEVEIPSGKYSCIVIDPPWDMQKIERDVRPNQVGFDYPTMTDEELENFPVSDFSAEDCHLFCWTTQKHLPVAMRLLERWGFRYVCTMVWHKPGGFQPIGLPQYNCEFVLYARKGSPQFVDTKKFFCCFEAGRREHSRKPDEFYDTIRRVTEGPRIDVFSREPREGFDQFGNEMEKFAA